MLSTGPVAGTATGQMDMALVPEMEQPQEEMSGPAPGPWGLAMSHEATCVLKAGAIFCRGGNAHGELGQGDRAAYSGFVNVGEGRDWQDIQGGAEHFCAINHLGEVWCWGQDTLGQTGTMEGAGPFKVTLPGRAKHLALGYHHSCALGDAGQLWCWGRNTENQSGAPTPSATEPPLSVEAGGQPTQWRHAAGGDGHSCAVDASGQMWCWGRNSQGQVGTGTAAPQRFYEPRKLQEQGVWEQVDVGQSHSCGIKGGEVWCWGQTVLGFVPPDETIYAPRRILPETAGFVHVAQDALHGCARRADGQLWCWGRRIEGQLGLPGSLTYLPPMLAFSDASLVSVAIARFGTCLLLESPWRVLCAGANGSGQFDDSGQRLETWTLVADESTKELKE